MNSRIYLLNKLNAISQSSTEIDESWSHVSITSSYKDDFFSLINEINSKLVELAAENLLSVRINGQITPMEEVQEYSLSPQSFKSWTINLNKAALADRKQNGHYLNIFLTAQNCKKWIENINPINDQNPIIKDAPVKIIIYDLPHPFGGAALYFLPNDIKYEKLVFDNSIILPTPQRIKENVHIIANFNVYLNPSLFALSNADYSHSLAKALLRINCSALAVCVVNEFYNFDEVVIDGIKRIALKVGGTDDITILFHSQLLELISWLYEDRVSTRKKLFNERLTLELENNNTLLHALEQNIVSALKQAKERYNFVILDRKDAYVKELKDLLKDLRAQSDLYALKIRALLTNFLRDTLAAIVLIGFTIFTKFTDNIGLDKNELLNWVFYLLAVYYVISMIMQAIVDVTDVRITGTELKYWKNVSKELIPDREFEEHRKQSLHSRKTSWNIIYTLVCGLYLLIAVLCTIYPHYFRTLLKTDVKNVTTVEHKAPKTDSTQSRK